MGLASRAPAPPSASNSVGDALIEWCRLTQDQTASFDRLSRVMMANKGWPDAEKMRARAEKAIAIDSFYPARTRAYFDAYPPQTPNGTLRMALALKASGRRDEASAAVRRRAEERRRGTGWVRTGQLRWAPAPSKKKTEQKPIK